MSCSCKTCTTSCCTSTCDECCDTETVIATALDVTNSWNVPACGESAILYIPGLTTALIDSFIYNPTYGAFRVTGINSSGGKLTVTNDCLLGNAAAGTVVPAGTSFVFGTPPTTTDYEEWTPVMTAAGAMTVSGITISEAKSFTVGTTRFFDLTLLFTLGGVASLVVYVSTPEAATDHDSQCAFPANVADNSGPQPGSGWRIESSQIAVVLPAAAVWTLGAGASINIQGRYQKA